MPHASLQLTHTHTQHQILVNATKRYPGRNIIFLGEGRGGYALLLPGDGTVLEITRV